MDGPPVQLHTFSFSNCYAYGVGSMLWHDRLRVLIVAGPNQHSEGSFVCGGENSVFHNVHTFMPICFDVMPNLTSFANGY